MKSLSSKAYRQLGEYDMMSCYKLCAITKAAGILSNYRKAVRKWPHVKEPYARRVQLINCYRVRLTDGKLIFPFKPGRPFSIPLNPYTISVLSQPDTTVRSITLTGVKAAIAYAKDIVTIRPKGVVGLDRNMDNVTSVDSDGSVRYHDLAKANEVKALYREVKSHMKRNDHRVRQRIFVKYGRRQSNRVRQLLHQTSKYIVENAKQKQHAIAMEKLTGLRKLYREGNGQGNQYRARMNSWSYAELQRQVEYKARWEGIPVIYVNPDGTSAKCSICGSRMARIPEENRKLKCHSCDFTVDRDVNAARNILAKGLRAVRFAAVAPALEAMVAVQRCQVDAGESTNKHALVG
jgi:putative transposase